MSDALLGSRISQRNKTRSLLSSQADEETRKPVKTTDIDKVASLSLRGPGKLPKRGHG